MPIAASTSATARTIFCLVMSTVRAERFSSRVHRPRLALSRIGRRAPRTIAVSTLHEVLTTLIGTHHHDLSVPPAAYRCGGQDRLVIAFRDRLPRPRMQMGT